MEQNEIKIEIGFTNKIKLKIDDKFKIYKTYNGFNHFIDYKILNNFDFVPKLLENNKEFSLWEFFDGKMLDKPTNEDLLILASNIRILHKSDVKFPNNNLRKRVDFYLKKISEKQIKIPAIDNFYHEMRKTLANMNCINPTHNDLWFQNILKNEKNKIVIVDWEYATMGDKHFDLAFFIESYQLSPEQEKIFLNQYNSFDDYNAYDENLLFKYKRLCHYITLCWVYAQDKKPFDTTWMEKFLLEKNKK